ncbi:MAG: hypothetical protein SFV18_01200 [Bryobacteraceae bacterium]|nr:hypothetical protein [Bryobacteraceae bacterium]
MSERKSFLIRIDERLLDQLKRWADDDLRSLNGQIEFLLRRALRDAGREKHEGPPGEPARPKTSNEAGA